MNEALRARWARTMKERRIEAGLSQAAVAKLCGVGQTTVSRWERGEMIPSEENKIRLAETYEVDPRDLFPLVREPVTA